MTKYALKSIPKETIAVGTIKNLELPKFNGLTLIIGDNNCGKTTLLNYLYSNTNIFVYDDALINVSYQSAKKRVDVWLREIETLLDDGSTIVIATNNSDVIREFLQRGVKTYRLGKSVRNSDKGDSILTDVDYLQRASSSMAGGLK